MQYQLQLPGFNFFSGSVIIVSRPLFPREKNDSFDFLISQVLVNNHILLIVFGLSQDQALCLAATYVYIDI